MYIWPILENSKLKLHIVGLALATVSFNAVAAGQIDENWGRQGVFYLAGGTGTGGANFSIGGGMKECVLEISSIELGTVGDTNSAKLVGLSVVLNAVPIKDFNLLFRLGFGRETTTFANGSTASMSGLGNGAFLGIGEQYTLNSHLAFRGELNRIVYITTPDGSSTDISYPITISIMYTF